jgi:hypothetical protein
VSKKISINKYGWKENCRIQSFAFIYHIRKNIEFRVKISAAWSFIQALSLGFAIHKRGTIPSQHLQEIGIAFKIQSTIQI